VAVVVVVVMVAVVVPYLRIINVTSAMSNFIAWLCS
jgi:hypothetical protein